MFGNVEVINYLTFIFVFIEGVLSFFSPCVIPLLPIYLSYLAGNTGQSASDGSKVYERKTILLHTVFFIGGISVAFFILGLAFTALGSFFQDYQLLFSRIGGGLIVLLGLFQLGCFSLPFLQRQRKLDLNLNLKKINVGIAFLLGFTFSFAWTPCVGPALASVLILASSAQSAWLGNILVAVYAIGFVIPFLLLGLFTTKALNFLKQKQKIFYYVTKAGGALLIMIGIMTFTGWMNGVTGYLSTPSTPGNRPQQQVAETEQKEQTKKLKAFDFTLQDQYGKVHTLSDYKGKVVFLNFWATWCPPCKEEMPHIEALYKKYNFNAADVVVLGVANPKTEKNPRGQDLAVSDIKQFLADNQYTFPVVFDDTGTVFGDYAIRAFPTTFMIDRDGNIFGYVSGSLSKEMMENIVVQTLQEKKAE